MKIIHFSNGLIQKYGDIVYLKLKQDDVYNVNNSDHISRKNRNRNI